MIYLKKFYDKTKNLKDNYLRNDLIQHTAKNLGFENRQLYKWIWDEKLREQ